MDKNSDDDGDDHDNDDKNNNDDVDDDEGDDHETLIQSIPRQTAEPFKLLIMDFPENSIFPFPSSVPNAMVLMRILLNCLRLFSLLQVSANVSK